MQTTTIDICIATYKRTFLLQKLLASLISQTIIDSVDLCIIIIDNDHKASAKKIVADFFKDKNIKYIYDVEPQKNIALTRNKALSYASADYIALIDDDEWAADDWLESMLLASHEFNADVVFGIVKPLFSVNAPKWVLDGVFFKPAKITTGELRAYGASNNTLIKRSNRLLSQIIFNPEYGLSGGEDTELFQRLASSGAKLISCKEAVVYEVVADERMTIKWLLKRSLRGGQVYAKVFYKNRPFYKVIGYFIQRVGYLLIACIAFMIGLLFGKQYWVHALMKVATNFGQISMFFTSKTYQEYK